jgi:hypothetical protein
MIGGRNILVEKSMMDWMKKLTCPPTIARGAMP